MSGGGEEALVGRDAETVYLRVGMLDGARANARERLPEAANVRCDAQDGRRAGECLLPDCVVVTSGCCIAMSEGGQPMAIETRTHYYTHACCAKAPKGFAVESGEPVAGSLWCGARGACDG